MKPYVIIDVPNETVKTIADEIHKYVHDTNYITGKLGWQFLDTAKLLSKCPTLVKFFQEHKLLIRDSAITVSIDDTQLPMHIDEASVIAKINFPVAHTHGWVNRWYHIPDEELKLCPRIRNQFDKEIIDLSKIKTAKVIAELENMDRPIVFNSSIPHSVNKIVDEIIGYRIVASFTFHNEPLSYLE